jgi:hypothetical protein
LHGCRNQSLTLKTPGQRVNERYGDFSPVTIRVVDRVDFHNPHDARQLSGVSNPASEA